MAKPIETEQKQINIIGEGTEIIGDIKCPGDIRIDGSLTGNLTVVGKVVVGQSGKIKGEISCKNSEIEGSIEGKVLVVELLSLKKTANIQGDIKTRRLAIEPGAIFTGNCRMNDNQIPVTDDTKKK